MMGDVQERRAYIRFGHYASFATTVVARGGRLVKGGFLFLKLHHKPLPLQSVVRDMR